MKRILLSIFISLLCISTSTATDRRNRLGIGTSNQLKSGLPAISFKLQKSKSFAFGGLLSYSTKDAGGGHGAALKIYRNIFEEPQLNFYGSLLGGIIKVNNPGNEQSGFQADLTLGSEFNFAGLTSLGFSVEFGMSFYKLNDFIMETVGHNFITAGVHFYL